MCELVISYQKNKKNETFTKIFNKYYPGLKIFLSSKFKGNNQTLEDAILISFERARIHIDKFDNTKNFKTWFYTIAKRSTIRLLEKEHIYQITCFENGRDDYDKIQINNIASKLLESKEDINDHHLLLKIKSGDFVGDPYLNAYDLVLEEILDLKDDFKKIIIDSYLNNMTFEKIMKKYNLSESQVKLKLMIGRKTIRKNFHIKKLKEIEENSSYNELVLPKHLEDIIDNIKYCGDLIFNEKKNGYSFKYIITNNKTNINSINSFIKKNNKLAKEIEYNNKEIYRMENDSLYPKKIFYEEVSKLEKEGFKIDENEIEKAISLNYKVNVKGIKTRNKKNYNLSNNKVIKIDLIKKSTVIKNIELVSKNINKKRLTLTTIENKNTIKIILQ